MTTRELFTVTTEWRRDELGHPEMRAITRFEDGRPSPGEWERLPDETHGMSDDQVAELVVQGKMVGIFFIERALPLRYVEPEEFEKLLGDKA